MADLLAVAGCKFFIGDATPAKNTDFVAGDFAAVTWQEVANWETMGQHGDTAASIVTPIINRARDSKIKGTRNAGTMENNFVADVTDLGQLALYAAEATSENYAIKIEYNDLAGGSTPSEDLFIALVLSAAEVGGGANTARMLASSIDINSNIVRVAAT